MAEKIKKAKVLRNSCINDLNALLNLSSRAQEDSDVRDLFQVRGEELDSIREEFNKHHMIVITASLSEQADLDIENTIREEFLNEYFTVKTRYKKLFDIDEQVNTQSPSFETSNHQLPKIKLPVFNGDYKFFPTFIDLYNIMVHDNTRYSDMDKFHHLVCSLEGPPLNLVRKYPLTRINYLTAYNALVERYSNKRRRSQAHWLEIDNTSKISSGDVDSLRNLLDTFSENIAALNILGFPTDQWDFVLCMMLLKRLDNNLIDQFDMTYASTEVPTYKNLVEFLEKRCISRENSLSLIQSFHPPNRKPQSNKSNISPKRSNSFFVNKNNALKCSLCKENHILYNCPKFIQKSPAERFNFCKDQHACFNCLSSLHDLRTCKSASTCRYCHKRHHTLLHLDKTNNISVVSDSPQTSSTPPSSQGESSSGNPPTSDNPVHAYFGKDVSESHNKKGVLLATAVVDFLDNCGQYKPLRCLLDSGSMSSFISKRAVAKLKLQKLDETVEIRGLDSMKSSISNGTVTLCMKPLGESSPIITTDAVILNKVCDDMPTMPVNLKNLSYINGIKLADSLFYKSAAIDVLLGADIFSKIVLDGKIKGSVDEPDAINTIFGYVLFGNFKPSSFPLSSFHCSVDTCTNLDNALRAFWELESVPEQHISSDDDALCENIFMKSHTRDPSGRYIVSLPFRDETPPSFLGSRDLALHRFLSLEKRLNQNKELYLEYRKFMGEYLELGHMSLIPKDELSRSSNCYYIPHHGVMTHKLRVVFNASAKLPSQMSLNDHLLVGPKLQQDIVHILLKFRLHTYVFCADIKMMYRMILVNNAMKDYQRIFWRCSPNDSLQEFRLNTVTYGLSSAPYLAIRTLLQLCNDHGGQFPLASHVIRNDTYVDDIVTGAPTLEEARTLQNELISLLQMGGFELRKWSSNDSSLLSRFPKSFLSDNSLSFSCSTSDTTLKILGLLWNPSGDYFSFSVQPLNGRPCSKRIMLSELARVYDPLGFLSPLTFFIKYLIQKLWTAGIGWDQAPAADILELWSRYNSQLPLLSQIRIPRRVGISSLSSSCEIHGFCDSSEKGYAAVVYLRICDDSKRVSVQFVIGKSKVSPLKKITIPRLELCACVLLSKLLDLVLKVYHNIDFARIFAWTDSKVALAWIKASPSRWKTFVSNRVAFIQEKIAPEYWFHVPTELNSADIASRGCLPLQFLNCTSWFVGPSFLQHWEYLSQGALCDFSTSEEERKATFLNAFDCNIIDDLLNRHSCFTTIQRIISYLLRFFNNCKTPANKKVDSLTSSDLYNALLLIVKRTQFLYFEEEISRRIFPKPLRKLNAFVDQSGLLRVGGRLTHSSLSYDRKHPLLLPRQSRLTQLLIEFYHKKYLHANQRTLHFLLCQQFWILSPRRAINSVISKCTTCWKMNPKSYQPPMGDLPISRFSQIKPFFHTGVDFAGPYLISMSRHRGVKTTKAYICIFVCFSTKAIHLELASDLSKDIFLGALQRFLSRRGRCAHLHSDCGTNFVGAYKELCRYMKNASDSERIEWHFNPPSAPHFGGLWESGVKSVKSHLNRVIGQQILTYEEFYTVLTLIESILNSRPLCAVTADPDVNCLTPGHFLTLKPLSPFSSPNLTELPMNRLTRWQLIQRLHQDFWKRWKQEYLHTLQQRGKWLQSSCSPQKGTLVLIKSENTPPAQWSLGRIIELHPGADKIVRVASVKTAHGTVKRPLVKLCPLPNA